MNAHILQLHDDIGPYLGDALATPPPDGRRLLLTFRPYTDAVVAMQGSVCSRASAEDVLQQLVEHATRLVEATAGSYGLVQEGEMRFSKYFNRGNWTDIDASFAPGAFIPGLAWQERKPYVSQDATKDSNVNQEIRETLGFYNLLHTPIIDRRERHQQIGCFEIHNTKQHRQFSYIDLLLLKELSRISAPAFFNAQHYLQTRDDLAVSEEARNRDKLTGVYTKDAMRHLIADRLKQETLCSLIFLDVDRFKKVNDTWGHITGDATLQEVASRIRKSIRPEDNLATCCTAPVAREGGDEFSILADCDYDAAIRVAERIIERIRDEPIRIEGNQIKVTASAGVINLDQSHGSTEENITLADIALYAAKNTGRNQVVGYHCLLPAQRNFFGGKVQDRHLVREELEKE